MLLAIWSSRMEVMLLLTTIAICCLIIGPTIFYADVFGNIMLGSGTNLKDIPTSKTYDWICILI